MLRPLLTASCGIPRPFPPYLLPPIYEHLFFLGKRKNTEFWFCICFQAVTPETQRSSINIFNVRRRFFELERMLFDMCNAASSFQKAMKQNLASITAEDSRNSNVIIGGRLCSHKKSLGSIIFNSGKSANGMSEKGRIQVEIVETWYHLDAGRALANVITDIGMLLDPIHSWQS